MEVLHQEPFSQNTKKRKRFKPAFLKRSSAQRKRNRNRYYAPQNDGSEENQFLNNYKDPWQREQQNYDASYRESQWSTTRRVGQHPFKSVFNQNRNLTDFTNVQSESGASFWSSEHYLLRNGQNDFGYNMDPVNVVASNEKHGVFFKASHTIPNGGYDRRDQYQEMDFASNENPTNNGLPCSSRSFNNSFISQEALEARSASCAPENCEHSSNVQRGLEDFSNSPKRIEKERQYKIFQEKKHGGFLAPPHTILNGGSERRDQYQEMDFASNESLTNNGSPCSSRSFNNSFDSQETLEARSASCAPENREHSSNVRRAFEAYSNSPKLTEKERQYKVFQERKHGVFRTPPHTIPNEGYERRDQYEQMYSTANEGPTNNGSPCSSRSFNNSFDSQEALKARSASYSPENCEHSSNVQRELEAFSNSRKLTEKERQYKVFREETRRLDNFYQLMKEIGSGTYGSVYKGRAIHGGQIVAIKMFHEEMDMIRKNKLISLREIELMQTIPKHKNLIEFYEAFHELDGDKTLVYWVMDFAERNLDQEIDGLRKRGQRLNDKYIGMRMKDLLSGLEHLHKRRIIHRDIKPANLLIKNKNCLKICDLGMAIEENNNQTPKMVTLRYRAPELFADSSYSTKVDLWSAGCVFGEMFKNDAIFESDTALVVHAEIEKLVEEIGQNQTSQSPKFIRLMNSDAFELFAWLLQQDPQQRFNATQALHHSYFFE